MRWSFSLFESRMHTPVHSSIPIQKKEFYPWFFCCCPFHIASFDLKWWPFIPPSKKNFLWDFAKSRIPCPLPLLRVLHTLLSLHFKKKTADSSFYGVLLVCSVTSATPLHFGRHLCYLFIQFPNLFGMYMIFWACIVDVVYTGPP